MAGLFNRLMARLGGANSRTPERASVDARPAVLTGGVPGILAQPAYPFPEPRPLSRLGGCPTLPDSIDWPKGDDGIPLHFLAQVDCAELPANRLLPASGTLFFFARIDDTMNWADGQADQDHIRVLHAPASAQSRDFPESLPPLEGGWHAWDREWRRPDEPKRRVYPAWPLTFAAITSWPSPATLPEFDKAYDEAWEAARAEEIQRARGWPVAPWTYVEPLQRLAVLDEPAFPGSWFLIDRVARGMLIATKPTTQIAHMLKDEPGRLAGVKTQAGQWIADARLHAAEDIPEAGGAAAFVAWLRDIVALPKGDGAVCCALADGMSQLIQAAAGSEAVAARVAPAWFAAYDPFARSGRHARADDRPAFPRPYHQLLGYEDSSQDPHPLDSGDVLLLTLQSDKVVDFMFGDLGEICFWIPAADLAAGRFEAVFATMNGG